MSFIYLMTTKLKDFNIKAQERMEEANPSSWKITTRVADKL